MTISFVLEGGLVLWKGRNNKSKRVQGGVNTTEGTLRHFPRRTGPQVKA